MLILSASFWDFYNCVFVYSMCMRVTIVYIYLCDCIGVFECEAHFNMIIVPASVWGIQVMGGGGEKGEWVTCFTVLRVLIGSRRKNRTGECDSWAAAESVGSVQSKCRPGRVLPAPYLMI